MKKALIVGIFALIFSALVFATIVTTPIGTYNNETGEATITMKPGWNIVPYGANEEIPGNCQLKAAWIWSPTAKKYIGGSPESGAMPQEDGDILNADKDSGYLYAQQYQHSAGGFWVYVSNECTSKKTFWTSASNDEIEALKLAKGWNFVTISPWMANKKLSDFLGDCQLSKIVTWDPNGQKWAPETSAEMVEVAQKINNGEDTTPFREGNVGLVYLFKVPQECNLGLTGATAPPALPD